MALFAISPRCNGASAAEGRPSVAGKPSSRQPVTQMYGAAVRCKRFSSICRLWILHQCIRPQIGAVCSGPSWISARVRSH